MLRGALPWVLLAATGNAQLYTTDAGVSSPEVPNLKQRFEWFARARSDELRAETRLAYSPDRLVQLDLVVPFVSRRVEVAGGATGTQEGLGDLTVATKWALLREDDVMRSDRLSALLDLRLPTGGDDARVDGKGRGRRTALGLSTFGAGAGLGYTLVRDRHRAAAAFRYWQWQKDDGFDPGEAVTLDLAWWYRLSPSRFFAGHDESEYRLTVELLSRWQADDRQGSVRNDNGGHELTAVLGLQCNLTGTAGVEAGILVPIEATTSSPFGHERFGFSLSFRLWF